MGHVLSYVCSLLIKCHIDYVVYCINENVFHWKGFIVTD